MDNDDTPHKCTERGPDTDVTDALGIHICYCGHGYGAMLAFVSNVASRNDLDAQLRADAYTVLTEIYGDEITARRAVKLWRISNETEENDE